jgi:glycosyltransferase involved in cell wall biosynthesis
MHICLLCYRGNPFCGGQGIYIYHLSRELANQGHEVTVLVGPPYPAPMPWARVVGLPNHHFWGKRRDFLPKGAALRILQPLNFFEFSTSRIGYFPEILAFSLRAFSVFCRLHRRRPFHVVHDIETLGYGSLLMRLSGVPVLSTVHHPLWHDMAAHLRSARSWSERYYNVVFYPVLMQRIVARRLDAVITASSIGRSDLIHAFRVRPDRIHIVPAGIEPDVFSPDPTVSRDPTRILFVGNAQDPRKGIRYLLEALRDLPPAWRLIVVDSPEPAKSYAPGLVRTLNLEERVRFTGNLTAAQLVHQIRRAVVLVMPSLFEGFGLPAAEAMACGTPVVATRAGALPEVVGSDEEGGLLVPPGDAKALSNAIRRILSQPDLAVRLAAGGRQRVQRLFNWSRTGRDTLRVYDAVRGLSSWTGTSFSQTSLSHGAAEK